MSKQIILISIFYLLSNFALSQTKSADKDYSAKKYEDAIPKYENAIKKNKNVAIIEKLADCYLQSNQFNNAEFCYEGLLEMDSLKPLIRIKYAEVLRKKGKIEESIAQSKIVKKELGENKEVEYNINSCVVLQKQKALKSTYKSYIVSNINTNKREFCPTVYTNKLVFVSEGKLDLVNNNDKLIQDETFYNIYSAEIKNMDDSIVLVDKTIHPFSNKVNTLYHDGPVSFNSEQTAMFVTRANYKKGDEKFTNRLAIYITELKNGKWENFVPFKYNSKDASYSIAHASISEDGQKLYFSSDMPGGFGGMDLYYSLKQDGEWGAPQNLGSKINSSGNEVFSFVKGNNKLFFASDGLPGYGGLDIFSINVLDLVNANPENIGAPINSAYDDFGIFFNEGNKNGFYSSNRENEKRKDDIYYFVYSSPNLNLITPQPDSLVKEKATDVNIAFKVVFGDSLGKPLANIKVNLLNSNGDVVGSLTTNNAGAFAFTGINPDSVYSISIDEQDEKLKKYKNIRLEDMNGKTMFLIKNKNKFQLLPSDTNILNQLAVEDAKIFFDLNGKLKSASGTPIGNANLVLVNEKNQIIDSITTGLDGSFKFSKLPSYSNYLVQLKEDDTNLNKYEKLILTDNKNKIIKTFERQKDGFSFIVLQYEQYKLGNVYAEDAEVKGISSNTHKRNANINSFNTIYFDYGKSTIKPEYESELNDLAEYLIQNPKMRAQINSYTDSRSSDGFNMNLSAKRTQAVVSYLLNKGVNRSSLLSNWYGETKLVNNCTNETDCNEEEHFKNRRTELKIFEKENSANAMTKIVY